MNLNCFPTWEDRCFHLSDSDSKGIPLLSRVCKVMSRAFVFESVHAAEIIRDLLGQGFVIQSYVQICATTRRLFVSEYCSKSCQDKISIKRVRLIVITL